MSPIKLRERRWLAGPALAKTLLQILTYLAATILLYFKEEENECIIKSNFSRAFSLLWTVYLLCERIINLDIAVAFYLVTLSAILTLLYEDVCIKLLTTDFISNINHLKWRQKLQVKVPITPKTKYYGTLMETIYLDEIVIYCSNKPMFRYRCVRSS